jgi:hypothetical protein
LDEPLAYYRIHGRNAWAQDTLQLDKFARYILDDQQRTRYLARQAAAVGAKLASSPLEALPHHLEFRMSSRKLAPEIHPLNETVLTIWRRAASATISSADLSLLHKVASLAWFTAVAIAPQPIAHELVKIRFVSGARPRFITWLVTSIGLVGRAGHGPDRKHVRSATRLRAKAARRERDAMYVADDLFRRYLLSEAQRFRKRADFIEHKGAPTRQ